MLVDKFTEGGQFVPSTDKSDGQPVMAGVV